MVSATRLDHVLNSILTQIQVSSATALGRGLVSGQGLEPDPTGRRLGHNEEMNQHKCSQVLTAPRSYVRATQRCQPPSPVSASWARSKEQQRAGVRIGQKCPNPHLGAEGFPAPPPKVINSSSLPPGWTVSPLGAGLKRREGTLFFRWLMFNRLSHVNQPEILI